jgi:hypothetical protein
MVKGFASTMSHLSAGIEELIAQLKRMESLEEENRALRAQLAQARQELEQLRRGMGIVVTVQGRPVPTGANNGVETQTQAPNGPPGLPRPPQQPERYSPPSQSPYPPQPSPFGPPVEDPPALPTGRQPPRNPNYADYFLD